jgi:LEA14-like dessication related protein
MKLSCFIPLSFLLFISGCTLLPSQIEKPTLHVADVRLIDAGLFEQRFVLSLRVQNPNDFDLPIEALNYELMLNDKPFAQGASAKSVTIPRYGSGLIEVEGISTLSMLLRQLPELQNGTLKGLRYQLKGYLTLQGFGNRVPFDQQGEIGLSNLLPDSAP